MFKPNEVENDPLFYFIEEGEIELFLQEKENILENEDSSSVKIIKKLYKQDYFGERAFFIN